MSSPDKDQYEDETVMMQVVTEDAKRTEERVLDFKGSIKGRRVMNRDMGRGI